MSKTKSKRQTRAERISAIRINTKFRRKLVVLFFAAILALAALVGRITYINVTKGEDYRRIVLSNIQQQYESRIIPFKRGDITDRNGTLLATSERVYNLILDCTVVNYTTEDEDGKEIQPYREPTIAALVKQFGLKKKDIEKILDEKQTRNSQYQILLQDVTMDEKEEWENYTDPPEDAEITKDELVERSYINGIWFEESYKRVYPQNSLACDAIGFTYAANEASWGIEGYYSDTLNGVNGRRFGYFNADADVQQTIIEPVNGNNVVSTLDINIQEIIRKAIEDFQVKYSKGPNKTKGAKNIAVLLLDPNTGEILGMDSNNWYDLNDPRNLSGILTDTELRYMSDEEKVEKMNEIWRNFCVSDAYEPGSVVKPITLAAALETASITEKDKFECDGGGEVGGIYVKCAIWPEFHGKLDFYQTIAQSCNDCMMQIVKKVGVRSFTDYISIFNYGEATGVDLPGENPGIIYTEDNMGELELATSSFGQGFTCTMVQEAAAIASIINGGYYYRPHIVSAITDAAGNIVERYDPVVERQTVSRKTSETIKKAMGMSVTEGTSMSSKVNGYSMGGKTGTAEKLPRGTGDYISSFTGFAPLDEPEVMIYVIVDEPNAENQDSSLFAQEIAKQVMTEVLPYLGVFPDEPVVVTEDEEEEAYYYEEETAEETVTPTVTAAPGAEQQTEEGAAGTPEDAGGQAQDDARDTEQPADGTQNTEQPPDDNENMEENPGGDENAAGPGENGGDENAAGPGENGGDENAAGPGENGGDENAAGPGENGAGEPTGESEEPPGEEYAEEAPPPEDAMIPETYDETAENP